MDKGEIEGIKKLAVIIIVIAVLFIAIPLYASTPVKISKSALSFLGLGDEETKENNDKAISWFNQFKKDLVKCSEYQDDNCLCDVPMTEFSNEYLLSISKEDLKIEAVNDGNKITLVNGDIENAACYYYGGKFFLTDFLPINFDANGAYIKEIGANKNIRLLSKDNLFKKTGNLCFIAEGEVNLPEKCVNRKV